MPMDRLRTGNVGCSFSNDIRDKKTGRQKRTKGNVNSIKYRKEQMATVEERVKDVTAQVLKLTPDQIKLEDSFTADLGAESVQSIELVAMFEEEFGIEMDEDAALSVETVGKAVEFITQVCKEQGVDIEE